MRWKMMMNLFCTANPGDFTLLKLVKGTGSMKCIENIIFKCFHLSNICLSLSTLGFSYLKVLNMWYLDEWRRLRESSGFRTSTVSCSLEICFFNVVVPISCHTSWTNIVNCLNHRCDYWVIQDVTKLLRFPK